jgi:Na+-transporting NADH:ubiquinone oxidoreductase subunit B
MNAWLQRCRDAWRAPSGIPVNYVNAASPAGLVLRRESGIGQLHRRLALAALPLLPFWLWNWGGRLQAVAAETGLATLAGWRMVFLPAAGDASPWQMGLAWYLPLLAACLLSTALVETIYGAARQRRVEPGWYLSAWLFTLLLPAGAPLPQAMGAVGLGVLLGRLIFGGSGKYFFSPALLAALLLYVGHPEAFQVATGLQQPGSQGIWRLWAEGGMPALQAADQSWWAVFTGGDTTGLGATSALACLVAAVYLVLSGTVSWRTLAGGLLGTMLACAALSVAGLAGFASQAPWYWHVPLGAFAFALVFLAADPACAPLTRGGRWFLGLAAGILTVAIRVLDPTHPDGSLHAVLLAALFAPLADEWVTRRAIGRRLRREAAWP